MKFKNGREAKNGDKVVMLSRAGVPVVGILYDAKPGNNEYFNGSIAKESPNDPCANLKMCLHIDDIAVADIPDSSKPPE